MRKALNRVGRMLLPQNSYNFAQTKQAEFKKVNSTFTKNYFSYYFFDIPTVESFRQHLKVFLFKLMAKIPIKVEKTGF